MNWWQAAHDHCHYRMPHYKVDTGDKGFSFLVSVLQTAWKMYLGSYGRMWAVQWPLYFCCYPEFVGNLDIQRLNKAADSLWNGVGWMFIWVKLSKKFWAAWVYNKAAFHTTLAYHKAETQLSLDFQRLNNLLNIHCNQQCCCIWLMQAHEHVS